MKVYNLTKIVLCLLITFSLRGQNVNGISIYPFSSSNRDDSIKTITKRVQILLEARAFFEKTYLSKTLVFLPADQIYANLFKEKPYIQIKELRDKKVKRRFLEILCISNQNLKKRIIEDNAIIKKIDEEQNRIKKNSLTFQKTLLNFREMSDYEVIFAPKSIFLAIDEHDPRKNAVIDSISKFTEQILLGKPHNIDGFVNSINYHANNFERLQMPDLIELLLQKSLELSKNIILNKAFLNEVTDAKISYITFAISNKLWVNTSLSRKTINLSPYLIRAIFNISLYNGKYIKLAEQIGLRGNSLESFFRNKTGVSAKEISEEYFDNFVNLFSKNLMFIIGHELAHIYLANQNLELDLEISCDLSSAYFYLINFNNLDLGIFESLLIKSIDSNELDFWGNKIDKNALKKRYFALTEIRVNKSESALKEKLYFLKN